MYIHRVLQFRLITQQEEDTVYWKLNNLMAIESYKGGRMSTTISSLNAQQRMLARDGPNGKKYQHLILSNFSEYYKRSRDAEAGIDETFIGLLFNPPKQNTPPTRPDADADTFLMYISGPSTYISITS